MKHLDIGTEDALEQRALAGEKAGVSIRNKPGKRESNLKEFIEGMKNPRRVIMSLLGVIITGASVGAFRLAALGVDPFTSFMSGMDALIPIGFGTLYMIVNAVLLLFSLIVDRHNIGIATFINLFLLGYVTQFSYAFLQWLIPEPTMIIRIISLIVGIIVLCFGSALYITADLGVSTYDAISIVMSRKWHLGKFKYMRISTDVTCVILGGATFLLAGHEIAEVPTIIGVGTIITAFFMGPLIELFNDKIARPILNAGRSSQLPGSEHDEKDA